MPHRNIENHEEDPELLLNKQSELVSKYRHKNKLILANIK